MGRLRFVASFLLPACAIAVLCGSRPASAQSACTLEPGPLGFYSITHKLPDCYTGLAWKIPACSTCPSPTTLIVQDVSFRVRWFNACSATAEVSIVGMDAQGCGPDPNNVLCGPVPHTISSTGAGGVVYTLPAPTGCCVTSPAYVMVRFTGFDQCAGSVPDNESPGLTESSTDCVNCDEFVSLASAPTLQDWCLTTPPTGHSLWMQVNVGCCQATPTHPRSWGSVKTLYR